AAAAADLYVALVLKPAVRALGQLLDRRLVGGLDELPPLDVVVIARLAFEEAPVVLLLDVPGDPVGLSLGRIELAHVHVAAAEVAHLAVALEEARDRRVVSLALGPLRRQQRSASQEGHSGAPFVAGLLEILLLEIDRDLVEVDLADDPPVLLVDGVFAFELASQRVGVLGERGLLIDSDRPAVADEVDAEVVLIVEPLDTDPPPDPLHHLSALVASASRAGVRPAELGAVV